MLEYSGAAEPYALYATTTYAYDARDLLTGVTDAAGNVTTIGYDSLGRKTSMADPDMGAWSYAYNPTGTLATQTDAKAQTLSFAYDNLDRLTSKTYSTGYPTAFFRYDEADVTNGRGQRTTAMNTNSGARLAYDERGRQTSSTHTVAGLAEARVFEWTYDSGDRVITMKYPALPGNAAREQVTYTYDAAWRQTGVGGLATYAQNATYTALDQPLALQFGNGVAQAWAYTSPMQRLGAITVGAGAMDRGYTYDNVGNVKTIVDNLAGQTQAFDYDHRDRLTHAATSGASAGAYDETYAFDPLGNLTSKGATASPTPYSYPTGGPSVARPHAPTSVGGRAQTYDADGNLTSDAGRLALTWSADNQPLTIAATDAGATPRSWGDQNCDGASQSRATPDPLGGLAGATAFARGNDHVLAVLADGTVRACGQNNAGQLGDGTTTARTTPVPVSGLTGVTAAAGGEGYSLALKGDGTVWAWGSNVDSRLGDGTSNQRLTPVQVSGLTGAVAIAAGRDFGLAVQGDGTVWAWGNNNNGHLGDGTYTTRATPVQVSGLTGVTAVAAGYEHALARKGDGTVWAWGGNNDGRLGDGTTGTRTTPVQVSGLTNVVGVAAGDAHSLAVKGDGTVWAWGQNNGGQLGDGTTTGRTTPTQTSGLTTATAVAAGAQHSLARLADGTVRAWGYNASGQLGDGTTTQRATPVTVGGLQGVDKIAARGNASLARPTTTTEQYAYDANGARVTRVSGEGTRYYLEGGSWEERAGANAVGPGSWVVRTVVSLQGRAVAQQESKPGDVYTTAGRTFLHGDHLGSVGAATDGNGALLSRQEYTPWGETRSGDVARTTLDFTGQRQDDTGLLYYGARYYDPKLGRFLSPDSIAPARESPQTRNRYSYVLNNPLKFTDPTGYCTNNPQTDADFQENAECAKYISWLSGWGLIVGGTDGRGIDPDTGLFDITLVKNINNWLSSQLEAVYKGIERMSAVLGWGTDGRLFRENALQGRTPGQSFRYTYG